jgi:hypothetical protein
MQDDYDYDEDIQENVPVSVMKEATARQKIFSHLGMVGLVESNQFQLN